MIYRSPLLLFIFFSINVFAQKSYPPPGQMIDMGGYEMHLLVEGKHEKGPTVIFFHGAGDIALHWQLVLPEVGKFANAIAFDQNGEGWSEHGHGMSLHQQVYDSHEALKKAGFTPPYIVVGHSLGGILGHLFTMKYKEEVAGLVLVDATHPDVVLKIFNKDTKKMEWKKMRLTADQSIPALIEKPVTEPKELSSFKPRRDFGELLDKFSERDRTLMNWIYNERPWTYVKGQSNTYEAEIFQEMYANYENYKIGTMPLIVISGKNKGLPKGDDNWSSEDLDKHRKQLQQDLLTLSTNSKHLIAKKSGHHIHIDEPNLLVKTIKKLVKKRR
ncbi:MAG: alpha/beta hydrolase [Bacteroidota bacterium]